MKGFRGSAPITEDWRGFEVALRDSVMTVTLNRPEKLNALTFQAYADLRDLLAQVAIQDVRALIITGRGRGFCSGGDVEEIIGELQAMDAHDLLEFTRMTGAVVQRMRECPVPIIAAVNGTAAGAGAVIALASDFRLLADSASFRFLFTKVGLAGADMGAAYLLPRLIGLGPATELLMLGEKLTAERALALGLAGQVVGAEQLMEQATALARRLSEGPAFAYATTKMLISRELDMDLTGAIEMEALAQALLMGSEDHAEFLAAFRAGREPRWVGR